MNNDLKVGDKVITYDGKFNGEIIGVDKSCCLIIFNNNIPTFYYNKRTLTYSGWSSSTEKDFKNLGWEGLKQVIPLDQYKKVDKEEAIELYLDDEDEYVD